MGNCLSKRCHNEHPTPTLNEDNKKDRLSKAGIAFKDIEFAGQIGYISRKHKSFMPNLSPVVEES